MSFKDSMMRGLAMYGVSSLAESGHANSQMILDVLNEANKTTR